MSPPPSARKYAPCSWCRRGSSPRCSLGPMHVAMSDAINTVQNRYTRVVATLPAAPGASAEAAAATAARQILTQVYPEQKAKIEAAYATSLKPIPDGPTKTEGITLGMAVAEARSRSNRRRHRHALERPISRQPLCPAANLLPPAFERISSEGSPFFCPRDGLSCSNGVVLCVVPNVRTTAHEAPRFHHAARRRGGMATRGARAAADAGSRIAARKLGRGSGAANRGVSRRVAASRLCRRP